MKMPGDEPGIFCRFVRSSSIAATSLSHFLLCRFDKHREDGEFGGSTPENPGLEISCSRQYSHAMKGYVYILASRRNGTLYTGVTSDLPCRLYEHQNELTPGFTSRYGVKTLVWFEEHDLLTAAITREKTIKKWPRQWKLNVIEAMNPDWDDISHYLHGL